MCIEKNIFKMLCLLLSLEFQLPLHAQLKESGEDEFNRIAEQYNVRYKGLMQTRGIHWSDLPISAKTLSDALYDYYGWNEIGILFYYYDRDTLKIWFLDQHGIQNYEKEGITENELLDMERKLKNAVGVSSGIITRAPVTRGAMIKTEQGEFKDNREEAIRMISSFLLPEGIAAEIIEKEHIIIVPTHNLGTIPFAVLQPFADSTSFVDHLSYSIAPNLEEVANAVFRRQYSDRIRDEDIDGSKPEEYVPWVAGYRFKNPLIIGNPTFPGNTPYDFPQLPGAEKEASRIGELFNNTRIYTGDSATLIMVTHEAPFADLLYFATHGIANSEDPLDGSFLVFAGDDTSTGFWTARAIQQTELSARLAVLSACQTGLGNAHDAGIIGLTRAFQIAGVEHVVMSLWNVNDQATADLMVEFISYLETNDRFIPAEALRQAILATRAKWPDPADWASFVVFGIPY